MHVLQHVCHRPLVFQGKWQVEAMLPRLQQLLKMLPLLSAANQYATICSPLRLHQLICLVAQHGRPNAAIELLYQVWGSWRRAGAARLDTLQLSWSLISDGSKVPEVPSFGNTGTRIRMRSRFGAAASFQGVSVRHAMPSMLHIFSSVCMAQACRILFSFMLLPPAASLVS